MKRRESLRPLGKSDSDFSGVTQWIEHCWRALGPTVQCCPSQGSDGVRGKEAVYPGKADQVELIDFFGRDEALAHLCFACAEMLRNSCSFPGKQAPFV